MWARAGQIVGYSVVKSLNLMHYKNIELCDFKIVKYSCENVYFFYVLYMSLKCLFILLFE